MRAPTDRDFVVISGRKGLRVELLRGEKLQAVRSFSWDDLGEALDLGERWLLLGPVIFALERVPVRIAA
mgnify:CR=1 FL=1|jgi:hypothetical protein